MKIDGKILLKIMHEDKVINYTNLGVLYSHLIRFGSQPTSNYKKM